MNEQTPFGDTALGKLLGLAAIILALASPFIAGAL